MSRLGRLFRSRIGLALLGIAIIGGGGATWAVTSGAPAVRQAANSLTNNNQDPTNTANIEDPTATATTDPGVTATATTVVRGPTATPRATATPCVATGQSVHWQGLVVSVNKGASTFVLVVGCAHPTIVVQTGVTNWTGPVQSISTLSAGANAEVLATRQSNGTYLATSINAQNDN